MNFNIWNLLEEKRKLNFTNKLKNDSITKNKDIFSKLTFSILEWKNQENKINILQILQNYQNNFLKNIIENWQELKNVVWQLKQLSEKDLNNFLSFFSYENLESKDLYDFTYYVNKPEYWKFDISISKKYPIYNFFFILKYSTPFEISHLSYSPHFKEI